MTYIERVATKATELDPARAILAVLAAPFYLAGALVGVLWLLLSWVWAAVLTGVYDVRDRQGDA